MLLVAAVKSCCEYRPGMRRSRQSGLSKKQKLLCKKEMRSPGWLTRLASASNIL